jgi:hypothetical protein
MTIAVLALALATSIGFRVPAGPSGPPKIICATSLPHRSGLYCCAGDRTRPTLSLGHNWSANGYHCARTTTAVGCRPGTHGFSITLGR